MARMDVPEAAPPPPCQSRRGTRTLLVIAACAAWAFLPGVPGMPSWRNPWMTGLAISTVIPVTVIMLIAAAPLIHRSGRWLDCTFGPDGDGQ